MPAPVRHSSAGRAATLTMRPPDAGPRHRRDGGLAAEKRGDEIHLDLAHQGGLGRAADRRHGEAAGEMD